MSETHETPAERRLREIREAVSAARRGELSTSVILTTEYEHAIDAGREALALWQKRLRARVALGVAATRADVDEARQTEWQVDDEARALLARCGEDA